MRPKRAYSTDATSFVESNRRRMMTFWKAPGIFTLLMSMAAWLSWLVGSGTVSFVQTGQLALYLPIGPQRPLVFADLASLPVGFLLTVLVMAMPVFLACLVFLFPLRLADGNTIISRPVFWRVYISLLSTLAGLGAFAVYDVTSAQVNLAPSFASAPLYLAIATTFGGIHLVAGHIGARWLVWSSGLFDARHVKEF